MDVVTILKIICTIEICIITLFGEMLLIRLVNGVNRVMQVKRVAPMTLNNRCTVAVRFAVFVVPALAMIAVTQVPMFWP